jgi:predicted Zn-dependent protease
MKKQLVYLIVLGLLLTFSCKKDKEEGDIEGGCQEFDLSLFSINDDKELGAQVEAEILANPTQYPVIDSASNVTLYGHLYRIRDKILNSGHVERKDDFKWKLYVIDDDTTLNAFCTPGGYIFVYTGLIRYLNSEDALAGVLGHEIAHADRRHSTKSMTRQYGINTLISIVAGNNENMIATLANNISSLSYSRCHEGEADDYSVLYLSGTNYICSGGAEFFEKIEEDGGSEVPEFLSTHPDPGNRIANYYAEAEKLSCNTTTPAIDANYQGLLNSLP